MIDIPEIAILRKLGSALDAVLVGADDARTLMGALPTDVPTFAAFGPVESTGARALLKAVEQAQDILARMFRTYLLVEQVDISGLTARDVANRMEKYDLLADTRDWSDLVRLRNRLAHEYPVSATEQLDRVAQAVAAVPKLKAIRDRMLPALRAKGYVQ